MATNRSLNRKSLDVALTRARLHLLRQMSTDGAYRDVTDVGPGSTAIPLIALEFAGHPLPPEDKVRVISWLRRQQRADGSFAGYPFAPRGDLCATALCWSALRMVGVRADDPAIVAAARFIAEHGGLDGVAEGAGDGRDPVGAAQRLEQPFAPVGQRHLVAPPARLPGGPADRVGHGGGRRRAAELVGRGHDSHRPSVADGRPPRSGAGAAPHRPLPWGPGPRPGRFGRWPSDPW